MNKTLHFFWFGGAEKSGLIENCIASWKKYLPDFEIKEWNENNFDVRQNKYISEAYDNRRFAFVSDFARFQILERYGGLYFDTDVELLADIHDLLELDGFACRETEKYVAPGLVLWVKEPHNPVMSEMLKKYENLSFINEDGTQNLVTVCVYFTEILKRFGLEDGDSTMRCGDFTVFSKEYFCPLDDLTGVMTKTKNTRAVHLYAKTWMDKSAQRRNRITRVLHRLFGTNAFAFLKRW